MIIRRALSWRNVILGPVGDLNKPLRPGSFAVGNLLPPSSMVCFSSSTSATGEQELLATKPVHGLVVVEDQLLARNKQALEWGAVFRNGLFGFAECHFCTSQQQRHEHSVSTANVLCIDPGKDRFECSCCGSSGNWRTLEASMPYRLQKLPLAEHSLHATASDNIMVAAPSDFSDGTFVIKGGAVLRPTAPQAKIPDQHQAKVYAKTLLDQSWADDSTHPGVVFLKNRGLSRDVCEKYKVGYGMFGFQDPKSGWRDFGCLTFLWLGREGEFGPKASGKPKFKDQEPRVLRIKAQGLDVKAMQKVLPAGGFRGFFGWHTIKDSDETIILTDTELDCLAISQQTSLPCISVPNGASVFTADLLPAMERFKRVVLFYADDEAGREGCESAAHKIGSGRCSVVRLTSQLLAKARNPLHDAHLEEYPPINANELLLLGYDLNTIISSAEANKHEEVLSFDDLRGAVQKELSEPHSKKRGIQSRAFPTLTSVLGGHRRGDLTVLTGPTGSGKTTFLSQLSLDYCLQGVPTLWGSFEIKNTRLIAMMIKQMAYSGGINWRGTPVPDDPFGATSSGVAPINFADEKVFNSHADEFDSLDMYFLRFFGSTDVDKVVEAMGHAVTQHDVQNIILDNLQFMISGASNSGGRGSPMMNKFDAQERALDRFRAFATHRNVAVTLVMHPRKEPEGQELSLESISGTAKAAQEADNVLILQRKPNGTKAIEVKKNRFSGDLGSVGLGFNRIAKCYRDLLPHGGN